MSQEAKGPISLSTNIAGMCIPSQIIRDSDPKILDTFDVFQDRSLESTVKLFNFTAINFRVL